MTAGEFNATGTMRFMLDLLARQAGGEDVDLRVELLLHAKASGDVPMTLGVVAVAALRLYSDLLAEATSSPSESLRYLQEKLVYNDMVEMLSEDPS